MVLDFKTYRDKVLGCWMGKNIGGVLGAPFEGIRQFNDDVDFYAQDLTMGPPPNDDLDLQIAWLAAVERYGRGVNASILGDYWLSYIIPNWVEYGMGKANLRAGMAPPISGALDNDYRNSCGCYIRSEIWACLAPGNPALAAKYAYEDAVVDHSDEGMQAELFCAALQSAAFVESDPRKLIDIGLSYVPEDGKFAAAIRAALDAKKEGLTFHEAIVKIHETCPGTFGVQSITYAEAKKRSEAMGFKTVGEPGMDAPENVAFAMAAWLYGKDFGERLVLSNSAGEDTDCTCATLGAILGIIDGAEGIPEKWKAPLGDKIVTMCIDKTWGGIWVPQTCTELAERVMRVTPGFLGAEICDVLNPDGYTIRCADELYCLNQTDYQPRMNGSGKDHHLPVRELARLGSNILRKEYPAFEVLVNLQGDPYFKHGENRRFSVTVRNCFEMRRQEWARISVYAPDGVEFFSGRTFMLPLNNLWGACAEAEFEFNADFYPSAKLELLVDVQLEGRHSYGVVKVVMTRKG